MISKYENNIEYIQILEFIITNVQSYELRKRSSMIIINKPLRGWLQYTLNLGIFMCPEVHFVHEFPVCSDSLLLILLEDDVLEADCLFLMLVKAINTDCGQADGSILAKAAGVTPGAITPRTIPASFRPGKGVNKPDR